MGFAQLVHLTPRSTLSTAGRCALASLLPGYRHTGVHAGTRYYKLHITEHRCDHSSGADPRSIRHLYQHLKHRQPNLASFTAATARTEARMAQQQRLPKRNADTAKPAAPRAATKRARRAVKPAADAPPSPPAASDGLVRCPWADSIKSAAGHDAYIAYHDNEWGRPKHDDAQLFELITLEAAQAGLSWSTILQKREAYRTAFAGFDAAAVAAFDADEAVEKLMAEGSGIVRHQGKIRAAINNARCFLKVQKEHGSFSAFAWSHVPDGKPIVNSWHAQSDVPTRSAEGDAFCAAMKSKGFTFFGPTISHTFMQAAGLVNDHLVSCHCYQHIKDSYTNTDS